MLRKKVLVIDDQAGIRALLTEVFTALGVEVLEAKNGSEGLETMDRRQPDMILLDMKMPGLSGIETLRLIRAKDYAVPIILVTAYQENDIIVEAERLGVTARLVKPFDIEELKRIVRRVINCDTFLVAGA
ncbi:MAG: Sporulation initiation phosphotransferase F [Firmicutes bacterium]|nr:Sporulation initiation phosphotransferase F [Bacillota bacterium]